MSGQAPLRLGYEEPPDAAIPRRRPAWVYAIVGCYGLLLLVLATSTAWLPLLADEKPNAWIAGTALVLILAELSLLMVPVRAAARRPLSRRALWIPLAGSGLLAGVLFLGGGLAVFEYVRARDPWAYGVMFAAGGVWLAWSFLFWFISYRAEPGRVAAWLHRVLLAGSVLELLVAVPTHVVCRRRTECCAGIYTGFGICCGVAVMLLAFGPSVGFLYYRRWKQVQVPEPLRVNRP